MDIYNLSSNVEICINKAMLKIITGADTPILRKKLKHVEVFDEKLERVLAEMMQTMLGPQEGEVGGVGLAANQVGIDLRIMITTFNVGTRKERKPVIMINPEIVSESKHRIWMEEGCLSLPGEFGNVQRPSKIKVRWQNVQGNWCEKKLDKWDARIFLHEYDHLDGKLFIDYDLRPSKD